MNRTYGQKTFNLDKRVSVECEQYETRYSWGHKAYLLIDGRQVNYRKITYYNRTWEAYTYQTILQSIVDSTKGFTKEEKAKYQAIIEKDSFSQDGNPFKSVAMIAAMGDLLTNNKKEANDWKARMLKAGLENKGLIMPEDWNELSETEKQRRLDGAIKMLR